MGSASLLFCAATALELAALRPPGEIPIDAPAGCSWRTAGGDHLLVSGVGNLTTAATLSRYLADHREVSGVVQLGIAGVYPRGGVGKQQLERSALLRVVRDHAADAGAWDGEQLLSATSLGFSALWEESVDFLKGTSLEERIAPLRQVEGATVEAASGSHQQAARRALCGATLESLEGAAPFALAAAWGIGALQIRALSNLCGPRDRSAWKIDQAIGTLRLFFDGVVDPLMRSL